MKHFLKVLFAALLCLAPTLGSDATQRVASLVSPQSVSIDQLAITVSDVGSLSVMGAPSGATFSLLNNPGGHFSISGTEIVADPSTPAGQYSLSVQASGAGYSVNKTFVLNYAGPPVGQFSVGINLSGAQDSFTNFPTAQEVTYYVGKNVSKFRLPIGWWGVNPQSGVNTGGFTGIQSQGTNSTLDSAYLAPLTSLVTSVVGTRYLLDVHTFGAGPGIGGNFQPTSITASANIATVTTSAAAGLVNGATIVIGGATDGSLSGGPYNGSYTISNVTGTTFQYTMGSTPAATPAARANSSQPIVGGEQAVLGSARLPCSAFGNLWGQISATYKSNVAVYGYDLMNEPVNGFSFPNLFACYQVAINAIRANGDTKPIYVEGVNFSAVWNWVSGEGQPFNNANLYQLTDSANNLVFSGHNYFDRDGSGTHFSYAIESTTAGTAPPGDNTGPNIGIDRLTPWVQWGQLHGVRLHYGEFATSSDFLSAGGNNNYPAWNTILDNTLAYLQTNNIETDIWGGGDFATSYNFNLQPVSTLQNGTYDYSSAGLQASQWVVIDKYTGFSGAQPIAYQTSLPVTITSSGNPEAPIVTPVQYGSVGVASGNFTIQYNGVVPVGGTVITPHATLMDGTDGAGTFTPPTVNLAANSQNALATFTYTPSQVATFQIGTTNNRGWIDPPLLGYTTFTDNFATLPNTSNICALYRRKAPYIGPAVRVIASDNVTQQDFSFNNRGDLPRQAIYNFANSTTPAFARIYNQTGDTNGDCYPLNFNTFGFFTPGLGNPPILNLNPTGYPETSVASTQWMGTRSPSTGKGLLTLISRVNGSSTFLSQSNFNTQFRMSTASGFNVAPNGPDSFVSFGALSGYNDLAGSYSNLYGTNNQKAYVNGSVVGQASPGQFTFASSDSTTFINGFRFGGQNFVGAWTSQIVIFDEASSGVISAFNSEDVAYYSTPLPDPFVTGNLPPVVSNTPAAQTTVLAHFFPPFGMGPNGATNTGTVVTDANPGGMDSAVITITGDAGATITGAGITGSNPYSIASTTPAALTSVLQLLQYQSSSSVGTVGTIALVVTSSSTHFATVSTTVTVGAVVAETAFAAPSGCTFTPPTYAKGVNISDGQVNYPSNRFNYIYPQAVEVSYFAGKGMTALRFPTTAPRLQPFAYRPMDPVAITRTDGFIGRVDEQAANNGAALGIQTNLVAMKAFIDQACSLNMYVLLEPHDFGSIFDNRTNTNRAIGVDAEGTAMFRDWWVRFSTLWKNYPNVIFQEENEPSVQSAAQWQAAASLVTSDIASVTTSHTVMLQGTGFDSCLGWTSNGNNAAWTGYTPPAGLPIVFECHQYLDSTASGTSPVCAGTGSSRLTTFTNWLTANSFKGYVGETGWSSQASCMTSATTGDGPTFLAFLSANEPLYFGWTFWLGGSCAFESAYIYTVQPGVVSGTACNYGSGTIDKPQLQTLINNLP